MTDSLKLLKLQACVWFSEMGKMIMNGDLEWGGMIEGTFLAFGWNLSQGNEMRFKPGTYKSTELLLPQLGMRIMKVEEV